MVLHWAKHSGLPKEPLRETHWAKQTLEGQLLAWGLAALKAMLTAEHLAARSATTMAAQMAGNLELMSAANWELKQADSWAQPTAQQLVLTWDARSAPRSAQWTAWR